MSVTGARTHAHTQGDKFTSGLLQAKLDREKIPELLESVKRKPELYNFDSSRRTGERHLRSQLWDQVGVDLNRPGERID